MRNKDQQDLTKKCRAIGCSKLVKDQQIFCQVHFPQLSERYLKPISDNREPVGTDVNIARRIITGTSEAVAYIARLEGKRGIHKRAVLSGNTVQTGGTSANTAPSSSSSSGYGSTPMGSFVGGTSKLQEQ